ncbi:MAG: DNA mismatch repair endonuclease MutL [Eubacteriales bacterium]|nr:DNA mismatch repair endonuclease MutL [Eubacteriales bacterium]
MQRISILDESTINKIAAGEVVESPASVIKELVENAIDANADEILIEIKNGGKSYIRVTDNGSGMINSEVNKAVIRHATSKITRIEDLNNLNTLGFRGEALASISAVSRFEMTSKSREEETAKTLKINGGVLVDERLTGSTDGTTIIVRDLFYNVPARKKFLKSDQAESSTISDLISKLSLSNTGVSFKLVRDSQVVLSTPSKTSTLNVITSVMGSDFSSSLSQITYDSDKISIKGFFTNLNYYRVNRRMQIIFVNGRFVSNKSISSGIEKAYATLLPKGKFPGFVIYINIDPNDIDVNIHPQKSIVKIDNIQMIEDLIYAITSKHLRERFLSKRMDSIPARIDNRPITNKPNVKISDNQVFDDTFADLGFDQKDEHESFRESTPDLIIKNNPDASFKNVYEHLNFIGPIFNGYLIFEDAFHKELYIMDQHAAHERINYEKLIKAYQLRNIEIQQLLIPEVIHLSTEEYEKALRNKDIFADIGFSIYDFGLKSIHITAIPLALTDGSIKGMFYQLLDTMNDKPENTVMKIDELIKKACVDSVKSGDRLSKKEVEHLTEKLSQCDSPHTCPHGRPIWIKFTRHELEKLFNRTN